MPQETSSWREHAIYNSAVMALVGGVGALLVAIFNTGSAAELPVFATGAGQVSFASVLLLVAAMTGAVVTSYSYRGLFLARKEAQEVVRLAHETRGRSVLIRYFAALGVGALFLFSLALVFFVVNAWIADAVVHRVAAIAFTTGFGALLSYLTAYWVITVRPRQLFRLALALLVISLMMGMASVADPGWWRTSMGYFGYPTYAELLFAVLILAACLLLLAVAMDIMSDLRVIVDIGHLDIAVFGRLKFGLYAVSLGVAGVGLLPAYINPWENGLFALAAVALTGLAIIGLFASPWVNPVYPRQFRLASLAAGAAVVALLLAWMVFRWVNFIAFQLLLVAITLAWVFVYQYCTTQFVLARRGALREAAAQITGEAPAQKAP
ncbi:MAG TPA: hypothetical protein VER79_00155 [Candidatus Limnocylindrales bacterium]|nr:hypothetical protein [Candidatus Limnocylindrales bacterium]